VVQAAYSGVPSELAGCMELVTGTGTICAAAAEVTIFNDEVCPSGLSKMDLIRYCLLDLEVYECSVRVTEKINFLESRPAATASFSGLKKLHREVAMDNRMTKSRGKQAAK